MNTSPKVWLPAGQNLSRAQRSALSVSAPAKPSQDAYQSLLAAKLQTLVNAEPSEAQAALEMSQESAPSLWLIAENQPQSQWGQAIASSDPMAMLVQEINWSQPGSVMVDDQETSLRGLLEQLP